MAGRILVVDDIATNRLVAAQLLAACGDKTTSVAPTQDVVAAAQEQQSRGFVFSKWEYEIPRDDAGECAKGMNITDEEFFSDEYAAVRDEVKKRYESGDREGALELLPAFPAEWMVDGYG